MRHTHAYVERSGEVKHFPHLHVDATENMIFPKNILHFASGSTVTLHTIMLYFLFFQCFRSYVYTYVLMLLTVYNQHLYFVLYLYFCCSVNVLYPILCLCVMFILCIHLCLPCWGQIRFICSCLTVLEIYGQKLAP